MSGTETTDPGPRAEARPEGRTEGEGQIEDAVEGAVEHATEEAAENVSDGQSAGEPEGVEPAPEAPRTAEAAPAREREGRDAGPWIELLEHVHLPAAMVDLDALDHNANTLVGALGERRLNIRLVTSALRSTGLLRHLFTTGPRALQGIHCSSVAEAALLAELGFDDLLIGAPPCRAKEAAAVAELVASGRHVLVLVDELAHGQLLSAAAQEAQVEIGVCIDVDATWQPVAEVVLGTRRSPVSDSELARTLADQLRGLGGLVVRGVMTWESGTAAFRPGAPWWAPGLVRPAMRRRSAAAAADKRGAVVAALREDGHPIAVVNGGSTSTLDLAIGDPTLTEISVGAGFLAPVRADDVGLDLRPALHFALPVARRPDPERVACLGGGWIGAVDGKALLPQVVWPRSLQPIPGDAWGEAYTTLQATDGEAGLRIGDPVICRPGQVAPVMERFIEVLLHRGATVVEWAPTYRGLGLPG